METKKTEIDIRTAFRIICDRYLSVESARSLSESLNISTAVDGSQWHGALIKF